MHHTQCDPFSAFMMNWTNCKKSRKRDTKHKWDMHQRHACLLWKIHEQEHQIHCFALPAAGACTLRQMFSPNSNPCFLLYKTGIANVLSTLSASAELPSNKWTTLYRSWPTNWHEAVTPGQQIGAKHTKRLPGLKQ